MVDDINILLSFEYSVCFNFCPRINKYGNIIIKCNK